LLQDKNNYQHRGLGPSHLGWALLLLAILTAAVLRFWQLGRFPPGLYRDEAYNGLDALNVLQGEHAIFFPENNGREPFYIYLTALFISLFGRSAFAVRFAAAVVGTLTTWVTYKLASSWFNWRVGLLSGWMWAITFWPVHLSRIGLRPILLAPFLGAMFWLGTLAYKKGLNRLWLMAGLVYGASFYTYLAIRFTPFLLLLLGIYIVWRKQRQKLWPGMIWFGLGMSITLVPLVFLASKQPDLILGRTGQVSILNPEINGGNFWGTLWRHSVDGLGMFLWRGDTILRHNPAGRPVYDLFMTIPFLTGLVWSIRNWERPPAMALLLWIGVMLGPTILAEDTPHFLRASGLLPAIVIIPAIGLLQLWNWTLLPARVRRALVLGLILASMVKTVWDYADYGHEPDVAYLFETAATELANQIASSPDETLVFVDERFWSGWPSIPFIVGSRPVERFQPEIGLLRMPILPSAIYAWPYGPLEFIPQVLQPPALIFVEDGGLARGDLDEKANPLYVRFLYESKPDFSEIQANFDDQLYLQRAAMNLVGDCELQVDLFWETRSSVGQELVVFVHILGIDGVSIAQDDSPVAGGRWPRIWWKPDLIIRDRHTIILPEPYDLDIHQVLIGVYDAFTRERLPVMNQVGESTGDSLLLETWD